MSWPQIGDVVQPAPVMNPIDAVDALYKGGFRYGRKLVEMTAVAFAESGLGMWLIGPLDFKTSPPTLAGNENGTVDRSWLMVNSSHQGVDVERLHDPVYAAQIAFALSQQGRTLAPWSSYPARSKPYMLSARLAVALHAALVLHDGTAAARIMSWAP